MVQLLIILAISSLTISTSHVESEDLCAFRILLCSSGRKAQEAGRVKTRDKERKMIN